MKTACALTDPRYQRCDVIDVNAEDVIIVRRFEIRPEEVPHAYFRAEFIPDCGRSCYWCKSSPEPGPWIPVEIP